MADPTIEIRALGPNAKQYIDMGKQLQGEFAKQGVRIQVPLLFAEPISTTVLVAIGSAVSAHILCKVIDRLLSLRSRETGSKTQISVNIEISNKTYILPQDRDRLLDEYSEE